MSTESDSLVYLVPKRLDGQNRDLGLGSAKRFSVDDAGVSLNSSDIGEDDANEPSARTTGFLYHWRCKLDSTTDTDENDIAIALTIAGKVKPN